MTSPFRIAGVVVLYNPGEEVMESIRSYADQVLVLYAVDNSESQNSAVVERITALENTVYVWNGCNLGVAQALNVGARLALTDSHEFLLLMDQDSTASADLVERLAECRRRSPGDNVGILAPFTEFENFALPKTTATCTDVMMAITSGSLLNLEAYQAVGPFMSGLFIDYVDFEYCLRLHSQGYRVIQVNDAILRQRLGSLVSRRLFFRRVAVTHHAPLRVYYRTRNRFVVARKYFARMPSLAAREIVVFCNEMIKILLFEEHRGIKYLMAARGILDFLRGKLGAYDDIRKIPPVGPMTGGGEGLKARFTQP